MKRYARGTHPYYQYTRKRSLSLGSGKKRRGSWLFIVTIPLMALLLIGGFLYARPLPLLTPEKRVLALATKEPAIQWPESQAAFGTVEQGLLDSKPSQTVRPTASVAKLLTVLTILQEKPLKIGEQGPAIPITQADIDIYNNYYVKNGSLAAVAVGEQISEYQMLQGVLLPSANNYADSLATWAFGSLDKYRVAAQAMAKKIGMNHTTIGNDASGFSPGTSSTAADLTLLGIAAIKQPVIAQIVKQTEVTLPVAGLKQNTNWLLGDDGVIGIKTGNTNEAGGVFIFAYINQLDAAHKVTLVGTIQGEPTVFGAVLQARSFIKQIKSHFAVVTPVKKGQTLGSYTSPWGEKITAVAKNNISFVTWPGKSIDAQVNLDTISTSLSPGSQVGVVTAGGSSSQVVSKGQFTDPSWQWRVFAKR